MKFEDFLSEDLNNHLFRITDIEHHNWDDDNLAHYIDGMQRAIYLIKKGDWMMGKTDKKEGEERLLRVLREVRNLLLREADNIDEELNNSPVGETKKW